MPRLLFDQELENLRDRLLALGSAVEDNVLQSVEQLRRRDRIGSRRLMAADADINREQIMLERDSLILIATQQPTARDLRFIASVIAIAGELERINDYAKGIAKINLLLPDDPLLPAAIKLSPMAAKAASMLRRSLTTFVRRDHDAACAIHLEDDEVDALYNEVYRELVDSIVADPAAMDQATHLLWAAHNLERTADRVSNICERVIFTVTGEIIELPEDEAEAPYPQ